MINDYKNYKFKLSDDEKEWLNQFTEEYVNADLDRKDIKNNLHNTKRLKKDCDKRNNDRKKDLYTVGESHGKKMYFAGMNLDDSEPVIDDYEDLLIGKLDRKSKKN